MSAVAPFAAFLGLTLSLLAGAVATGLRARRRIHLTLVSCTVLSLAVTIFFAGRLGRLYDLEAAGWITPVHLSIARLCTAAYLLPFGTGLWTLRHPEGRPWHRRAAFFVVGLTVLTAATGTWMILASPERRPLP